MTAPDLAAVAATARRAADAAAQETLQRFRKDARVEDKGDGAGFDPVTQADRAAEAAMRGAIAVAFPDHGVLGEEMAHARADADWIWTIDPIDGTRAFIAGVPTWTTLIAFGPRGGAPVFGLVDQPYLGERYLSGPDAAHALTRGDEQILKTRACARLEDAAAACTDPVRLFRPGEERERADALLGRTRFVRGGLDAYAYARLAAGDLDLIVEADLKWVDMAALIPLVRGAGGLITNWLGEEPGADGRILAAGDPRLHDAALTVLNA